MSTNDIILVFGTDAPFQLQVPQDNLVASSFCRHALEENAAEEYLLVPFVDDSGVAAVIVEFLLLQTVQFDALQDANAKLIYGVLCAADAMGISELRDYCISRVAQSWEGVSAKVIRAEWGFADTISPSYKSQIAQENAILFPPLSRNNRVCKTPNKEWYWPPQILDSIVGLLSVPALAHARAVSSDVLAAVHRTSSSVLRIPYSILPSPALLQSTLGFAEQHCVFDVDIAKDVSTVFQLNAGPEGPVHAVNLFKDFNLYSGSDTQSPLSLQRLSEFNELECLDVFLEDCENTLDFFPSLKCLKLKRRTTLDQLNTKALARLQRLQTLELADYFAESEIIQTIPCLQRLECLKIGMCNKFGLFAREIFPKLSTLKRLEIGASNHIGEFGARALSVLKSLEHVCIGGYNDIGTDGVRALGALHNLCCLEIGARNFGSGGLETFSCLQKLECLKIGAYNTVDANDVRTIASLQRLRHLRFQGKNSLDTTLLAPLRNLQVLELGFHNNIGRRGMKILASLQSLQHLEIGRDNNIGPNGLCLLGCLKNLQCLILDGANQSSPDGVEALACFPRLKHLEIGQGTLGEKGAHALASFPHLQELHVGGNQFDTKSLQILTHLQYLTTLVIGKGNWIGGKEIHTLARLQALQTLEIGPANRIGADGARAISKLKHLQTLKIDGQNELGTDGATFLSVLPFLVRLEIGFENRIGADGVQALSSLPSLRQLHIGSNNNVCCKGACVFCGFEKLQVLNIAMFNNGISHDTETQLKTMLPYTYTKLVVY